MLEAAALRHRAQRRQLTGPNSGLQGRPSREPGMARVMRARRYSSCALQPGLPPRRDQLGQQGASRRDGDLGVGRERGASPAYEARRTVQTAQPQRTRVAVATARTMLNGEGLSSSI